MDQDERILASAEILNAHKEIVVAENTQANNDDVLVDLQIKDDFNKTLVDDNNHYTDKYQGEFNSIDGDQRILLTEQHFVDSAQKVKRNMFFPNDPDLGTTKPNIPNGIWTKFGPFSKNIAVGHKYDETIDHSANCENDQNASILSAISGLAAWSDAELSSGQECSVSCSCDGGSGATEAECIADGGTWDCSGDAEYDPHADIIAAKLNIVSLVNGLISILQGQATNIVNDDDEMTSENTTALNNNIQLISDLQSWLAYQDFDTTTTLPTTCVAFYAMPASSFEDTKLNKSSILNNIITNRNSYLTTRTSEIGTRLGSIAVDGEGVITGGSGLYYERFLICDLRLNLVGGTLSKIEGVKMSNKGLGASKASSENKVLVYESLLEVTQLMANCSGNTTLHVADNTGFSVGEAIFIVAKDQVEIQLEVVTKYGDKTIVVDKPVNQKYRIANLGRVYKEK